MINNSEHNKEEKNKRVIVYDFYPELKEENIKNLKMSWEDCIKKHNNWELVAIYLHKEEGKKHQFYEMYKEILNKDIDLLLVQNMKKLGNSFKDRTKIVELLESKGIEVFFLDENIGSLDTSYKIRLLCEQKYIEEMKRMRNAEKMHKSSNNKLSNISEKS